MANPESHWRPTVRSQCADIPRPCPYVGCKYNLFIDVNESTGSIKFNCPGMEPDEMEHSCALDVAEKCGWTLQEVGNVMNVSRERIRQVEEMVQEKMLEALAEHDQDFRDVLADSSNSPESE